MRHSASRWLVAVTSVLVCAGFAPALSAAEIAVAAGESIQAAIDKAKDGDTIKVAAGVFPENLSVAKPITLEGAGWEKTTVGAERMGGFTQRQKDEFFAALEATSDKQERARIAVAFVSSDARPALSARNARGVTIRGVRFRGPAIGSAEGGLSNDALVVFDGAAGTLSDCAIIGPFMNGVNVMAGSDVTIEKSLVAAMWGTGVAASRQSKLNLRDSDVRNCYHRCVTLGTDDATIERCRISGSAWHGVRYDGCSPKLLDNHIFANARSGIYASGKTAATVRGNVFWRNEMDAMSCWFDNSDAVEANTIVGNLREGISVLGNSKTRLTRNLFVDNPIGVHCGKIAARGQTQENAPMGTPVLEANVFFNNPKDVAAGDEVKPLPPGNEKSDPRVGGAADSFKLAADSPARKLKAGAADPIAFASPFPVQAEEKSIVPDSETRDYSKWKRLAAAQ